MFTIGLIDSDRRYSQLFRGSINRNSLFNEVFTFKTPKKFLSEVEAKKIDVNVLLLTVPEDKADLIGVIPEILERSPKTEVVVLSPLVSNEMFRAFKNGASGYIFRETPFDKIAEYLDAMKVGGAALSPDIARKIVEYFNSQKSDNLINSLNSVEFNVLKLLSDGKDYKEIAQETEISLDGVRYYIKRIYKALNVHSKGEAIRVYYENRA
jgi:DNA-binding NarL/FixJ family response regulator